MGNNSVSRLSVLFANHSTLFDEPISHLDEENGRLMSKILVEETDKQGAGIIVTSIGKHLELNYTKILRL